MAIISTIIAGVILFIRKITYEKISPKCNYIIWIVFMIALIFPIPSPSRISIYNYIDLSDIKEMQKQQYNNILNSECDVYNNEGQNEMISEIKYEVDDTNIKILGKYFKFIIVNVWFAISTLKLIGVMYSYRILMKKIGNEEVNEERIVKILEKCKKELNINKNIKIMRQDFVKMPSIVGWYNVKILLTDSTLKLDDDSLNYIIIHELSHYKRKDNFMNFFMMIAKSIYWFNPVIKIIFKYIKMDMEFATDEMAISKMGGNEKREYCKAIVEVASICSSKVEPVLGMANDVKTIEQRIDMIVLRDKFEKNSIPIILITISIILLIWFILYPTSYGMTNLPKLYLKLDNGEIIEPSIIEKNSEISCNTIECEKNEIIKLMVEDGKCEDYVFYNITDLKDGIVQENIANISSGQIILYENGEYIYKFTLNYGKNKTINYAVKILVQ